MTTQFEANIMMLTLFPFHNHYLRAIFLQKVNNCLCVQSSIQGRELLAVLSGKDVETPNDSHIE